MHPDRQPDTQLTITLNERGQINVQGPIQNKLMCYGLLELAKDAIAEFHVQQAQKVQPATDADLLALTDKN